jgi:quaternary ammonium compound-resistance protein SugE
MAQAPGKTIPGILIAIICMFISGFLLYQAQKHIPMGTAYAVWTGIGAAGTFVLGVFLYHDPLGTLRVLGAFLIIAGVILLKIAH